MKSQHVTTLPLGYDEQTQITLTPRNEIVAVHPLMPPIIYDEQVMRWVELKVEEVPHG
jgi:putative SOS response-associated peptidase YedK